MTLVGFAFKIAAAPFHLWAPDTYQGAPVSSAAFIASASKVASFVVLGKIVLIGFNPAHGSARLACHGYRLVAPASGAGRVLNSHWQLCRPCPRPTSAVSRLFCRCSRWLHLARNLPGGRGGLGATLFYTTIYAFTLVGAFAVVALVRDETGGDDLKNFAGLYARSPLLAGCMVIFMLSLAGLPPLAGFFGKFYLFQSRISRRESWTPLVGRASAFRQPDFPFTIIWSF